MVRLEDEKKMRNEIAALTNCLNERLEEISELHRKNTALYQKISEAEEKYFQAEQEKKRMGEQAQSYQKREESMMRELHEMKKNKETAERKLKAVKQSQKSQCVDIERLIQENEMLKQKILQMEHSKSWKITRPLRAFLWKMKGV